MVNIEKDKMEEEKPENEIYDYFFHESRFPIIEQKLSLENAKRFRNLSNENKALFINVLIRKGVLSW